MEPNNPNKEPAHTNTESKNFKRTETTLIYVSKYVTRDDVGYDKKDEHKFGSDGLTTNRTLIQKRFHCQHLCHGIKNWGREIFEEPHAKDKDLEDFYKTHQYIIVCDQCSRDCFVCGAPTSTVTGCKRDGKWHCAKCNKKAKRKEFWKKVRNFIGGKLW
jgi:hypothetical protein